MKELEITDEMVERAAMALYGELAVGPGNLGHGGDYLKDDLRLAARNILWAALDPLWGKR